MNGTVAGNSGYLNRRHQNGNGRTYRHTTPIHKSMERKFGSTTTPLSGTKWKSALLTRCLHRARQNRQDKFSKLRRMSGTPVLSPAVVSPVVNEEAKSIIKQELKFNSNEVLSNEDVFALEHLIMKELLEEEERILRYYEELQAAEAAALEVAQKDANTCMNNVDFDSVLCPICCKNPVNLRQCVFFCSCGFRLDAASESMTLAQFKTVLANAFSNHSNNSNSMGCAAAPTFSIDTKFGGVPLLVLRCEKCNYFQVV
mmetsp:Transcript_1888/g.2439  ORF Transcript_1888/g.2439 Transcript_1888/m.2439 type:complete len:257 (-) Transcript_1888:1195-1965(-)|eukprot:CAMPEP_0204834738 /NCGR_PEP_ID=MMETSP1346-20131115/20618_1 /ASSEMBLY_ACC=CAM_ASM_000771 /TAXON_ID=215587 /ORGANISM="Aplanochytrium stocchinoi, Strain GSBS06" /LENGTH=256 /DNA_ID=CAMNT_0051968227 /DNA_START=279 /DNA_END=1049 /DNA_ORIENTATION=-